MSIEGKRPGGNKPEGVVDLLPREFSDKRVDDRLRRLTRSLDQLVVEADGQLFVNTAVVQQLLRDDEIFPAELRDQVQKGMDKHLGERYLTSTRTRARGLTWEDLARREPSVAPMSVREVRDLGISRSTSTAEARRIFTERFPDFPGELLDADGPALKEIAVRGIQHNRTVWDCVVSKIGYWAALGVFVLFGSLLIIGTATGPWGIPLAIFLAATLGAATAVMVANCVLHPNG